MSQHGAGDAAPHEDHEMTYGDVFSGEEKPFWPGQYSAVQFETVEWRTHWFL